MQKPMQDISLARMDSLLEITLRTTTANFDPYKDDLRYGEWYGLGHAVIFEVLFSYSLACR